MNTFRQLTEICHNIQIGVRFAPFSSTNLGVGCSWPCKWFCSGCGSLFTFL